MKGIKKEDAGGYGASLKKDYRAIFGASVHMAGRGEAVAKRENYCKIDPAVVDKYGIPVLQFHTSHSEYEIKQAKHMMETFSGILHAMGAIITHGQDNDASNNWGLHAPGNIIHEAGTVRMGNDPKTSPLNKWSQAHDCKNLFCMDGGPLFRRLIRTSPGRSWPCRCGPVNTWWMNSRNKTFNGRRPAQKR